MKKHLILILILMVGSLVPMGMVAAQDPTGAGDNACYEQGSMWRENPLDRCNTVWAWVCGWYLARYEKGELDEVPEACQILLDLIPRPTTTITLPDGTTEIIEEEPPADPNCLTLQTVFPGTEMCVSGNMVTFDGAAGGMALPEGPDGVVDTIEIIVAEGGPCPVGSNFYLVVSSYTAEIEDFVVPRTGASPNDWVCLVAP